MVCPGTGLSRYKCVTATIFRDITTDSWYLLVVGKIKNSRSRLEPKKWARFWFHALHKDHQQTTQLYLRTSMDCPKVVLIST